MNDHRSPHKINNSYESPSSGSVTSSSSGGDINLSNFMNFNQAYTLNSLILSTSGKDHELYNTSAEEGIFPNIASNCPVYAPSYDPEYDYYNQYSTTPLVYSWMPIVPGFSQERTDNLYKFDDIVKKLQPHPLNISNITNDGNSSILSDQNIKFAKSLVLNSSQDARHYILNNSSGMNFNHQLDDSCNAMDLNISCNMKNNDTMDDLSFNGKIPELTETVDMIMKKNDDEHNETIAETVETVTNKNIDDDNENSIHDKEISIDQKEKSINEHKSDDCSSDYSEKLRNESFELLKQEDSSKMLIIAESEKSPVVTDSICDHSDDDEAQDLIEEQSEDSNYSKFDINTETTLPVEIINNDNHLPTLKDCDDFLLKKFKSSLSEICPPPSIATLPLSLSEMIAIYKKNLEKPNESFVPVKSNSMFVPSHPFNETLTMEWPQVMDVKAHGVLYNRSTDCEQIELMTVKYVDRYIKTETASSYNHKIGPASAKKRIEKLKLLTQSPSSRLSHLANRRKVFSSTNLKSTTATTSHKTFANSKQLLIDKSKLYQKKKRNSAKKKTPGKRKTPKSAKRQVFQISKPEPSAASSKRALFVSPLKSRKDENTSNTTRLSRDIPIRGQLPKRTLFSPPQKRKRSPSPDDENKYSIKTRRLDSPSRLMKSKSFSIAAATSSSGCLDEHFRKTLYYRTQSEMVLNQSSEGNKLNSNNVIKSNSRSNNSNLGFRKPFSDTEKKKLLWTASSALQSKQINRDHAKFKEHMSNLCKLVKKIFTEFYNPTKSMSAQMTKFSNLMVYYVVQGRPFDEIYLMTKNKLEAQNPLRVSGYIAHEDYQRNHFIRKNSSLLLMSNSSLNLSAMNDSSLETSYDRSGSDSSLNRTLNENIELKENFSNNLKESSSKKKLFAGSDSNLNVHKTSTPSSNILKAKRQISF